MLQKDSRSKNKKINYIFFGVSRQKQLSVVFDVANAQKQGVADAECIEAEETTMFQEDSRSKT